MRAHTLMTACLFAAIATAAAVSPAAAGPACDGAYHGVTPGMTPEEAAEIWRAEGLEPAGDEPGSADIRSGFGVAFSDPEASDGSKIHYRMTRDPATEGEGEIVVSYRGFRNNLSVPDARWKQVAARLCPEGDTSGQSVDGAECMITERFREISAFDTPGETATYCSYEFKYRRVFGRSSETVYFRDDG